VNEATARRRALARRLADVYVAHTHPRAILLVGSVAEGLADDSSDIDLIVYHAAPPDDSHLEAVHQQLAPSRILHPPTGGEFLWVDGVECQVAHLTVAEWEAHLASVLDDLAADSIVHKMLMGLMAGEPLHGANLVQAWQARAGAFPEGLRRAMVEHYLGKIAPLWYFQQRWPSRDATLWLRQTLVESAFCLLGIFAGLNGLYFHPFQFKRARQFVDRMAIAPRNFADRLDLLALAPPARAIPHLEAQVQETLRLVPRSLPDANLSVLSHQPGERQ
jgi:hypothetical protein